MRDEIVLQESAIQDMAIMIVDDSDVVRIFLEKSLRNRGFTTIASVESGERALQELPHFNPDLLILDVMMPGIDGFTCCSLIRAMPEYCELPILICTSAAELALRVKAFESGATDFIHTPILQDELFARVTVHLANRRYIKALTQYKNHMTQEMNSARLLQKSILPGDKDIALIYGHSGLDIAAHFEPSLAIGGDVWGVKAIDGAKTALWMVDFSGHGITAALNAFRLQAYLREDSTIAALPGGYMTQLNSRLLQLLLGGHFATMFYGVLDTVRHQLFYSCACAPNPVLVNGATGEAILLPGKGNLLGIGLHEYPTYNVAMRPGDTLILYSDALTETPDSEGRYMDESTLLALAAKYAGASATQLRDVLLDHFQTHSAGRVSDDFTLCVSKRRAA